MVAPTDLFLWCAKAGGRLGGVRRRRLRNLVPDDELIRRRAAGEPFRSIAPDYGVAHTTLVRYFERPEVTKQVKQAERQLRAERRAAASRELGQRRLERSLRRKAEEQVKRERELARGAPSPAPRAALRPRVRSDHAIWLDERDARRPLTRADLHSENDRRAARAVSEGGGIEAVIEATGLRAKENVCRLVDPAILKEALDNDVLAKQD